jgi:predicted anti-sigma-YlaC factor YlaD
MSCDHQVFADNVCDYIEGKTTAGIRARCDEALQHCAHCRDVHAQALEFYALADKWQDQAVPEWNRARFVVPPARQVHAAWPAWGALAASLAAIVLVLARVEISTTDGLLISFGGSQTDARVQELVAAELARHDTEQELLLDARLDDFAADQINANQLMLARYQEATRLERRQELGLLMTSWQSQRFEDQQEVNNQLTSLANDQIENNQYLNVLLTALPRRN